MRERQKDHSMDGDHRLLWQNRVVPTVTPDPTARPRTGAQAIERALAVLACFEHHPERAVTDIEDETGLSNATAHRIVRALCNGGLLEQDPATERYHLGYGTALLGRLALDRLGLNAALPLLEELAAKTGEAINLGIRVGHETVVVSHVPSSQTLRIEAAPGARNPIHACAMGKALLAYGLPLDAGVPLPAITPHTITSVHALEQALEEIRSLGYAVNNEERTLGVRSVAAPIFAEDGRVVAAVAVQAPTVRLPLERVPEVAAHVLHIAAELRGKL
ncbi:IclR family transcriptional regulator [Nonomuraea antimicrobica]